LLHAGGWPQSVGHDAVVSFGSHVPSPSHAGGWPQSLVHVLSSVDAHTPSPQTACWVTGASGAGGCELPLSSPQLQPVTNAAVTSTNVESSFMMGGIFTRPWYEINDKVRRVVVASPTLGAVHIMCKPALHREA
jgi:hypothetical protein